LTFKLKFLSLILFESTGKSTVKNNLWFSSIGVEVIPIQRKFQQLQGKRGMIYSTARQASMRY